MNCASQCDGEFLLEKRINSRQILNLNLQSCLGLLGHFFRQLRLDFHHLFAQRLNRFTFAFTTLLLLFHLLADGEEHILDNLPTHVVATVATVAIKVVVLLILVMILILLILLIFASPRNEPRISNVDFEAKTNSSDSDLSRLKQPNHSSIDE